MLSKLRPKSYQSYLSLPILGPILDEFTSWSYQRGYTIKTIKQQLKDVRKIENFFVHQGIQALNDLTHTNFETAWQHYRLNRNIAGTIRQIELFLDRTQGLAAIVPPPKTPTMLKVDCYAKYLREIQGLSSDTIYAHTLYIQEFLEYIDYNTNREVLKLLTSKEIERFIILCSQRMNRHSLQRVVGHLRSFFRFEYEQGRVTTHLYAMIDTPRTYRLEKLPRALDWETINKLLLSIDRSDTAGIRDYTMLYLMATYGLRSSEVISLTLDDIDWKAGVISIAQTKTNSYLFQPLTDTVGEVLIQYLKRSCPKTPYRHLFLRVKAPYGPLKRGAIYRILEKRIRLSGLDIQWNGTHCIRHSVAVHHLRQGSSLKDIGDILGHRDTESTCIYLRLAIEDLREVALSIPQETITGVPENIRLKDYPPPKARNAVSSLRITSSYSLRSFLANDIRDYINLKRSLGRDYRGEARTLYSFDVLLATHYPRETELTAEMFNNWCSTLHNLSPTTRRRRMYVVHNLCLYRNRSYPQTFIPDVLNFPEERQKITPYIFSKFDVARLIRAAESLQSYKHMPLRPETIRLAIVLFYTTGLRRGELLRLKLDNFNQNKKTLLIENTKFHKSRIVPLSSSVACEVNQYLDLRHKKRLPMDGSSPLILKSNAGKTYTSTGLWEIFSSLCTALKIFTREGKTPRLHDLRHVFACHALQRWYQQGKNVQAKLPLLATYMGHVSIVSTHYYLQFIEEISSEVSARFYENFGKAITKTHKKEVNNENAAG